MNHQQVNHVLDSKMAAKQDMISLLWPTMGATLLYLVPVILTSAIFSLKMGGGDLEKMAELSVDQIALYMGIYMLAQIFIIAPLYFGLTQFYALRRAGATPSASMVTMCLSSLKLYAKSIRMYLSIGVHSVLWVIPLSVAIALASVVIEIILPNTFGYFILFELIVVGCIVYACLVARYQCAYALVMEDTKLGCWQAVRKAAKLFKNHKRDMLSLICSFFLWFILVMFAGEWLMLYVCPYFVLSLYHLFDRVRGVQVKTKPAGVNEM